MKRGRTVSSADFSFVSTAIIAIVFIVLRATNMITWPWWIMFFAIFVVSFITYLFRENL